MSKRNGFVVTTFEIETSMEKEVKAEAKKDMRSRSMMIRVLIREALDARAKRHAG